MHPKLVSDDFVAKIQEGLQKRAEQEKAAEAPTPISNDEVDAIKQGIQQLERKDLSEAATLNPRSPVLPRGAKVRVPHKGKMVDGKVVRYDLGGYQTNHGWPFYVVDVGEYESIKVPVDRVEPA